MKQHHQTDVTNIEDLNVLIHLLMVNMEAPLIPGAFTQNSVTNKFLNHHRVNLYASLDHIQMEDAQFQKIVLNIRPKLTIVLHIKQMVKMLLCNVLHKTTVKEVFSILIR